MNYYCGKCSEKCDPAKHKCKGGDPVPSLHEDPLFGDVNVCNEIRASLANKPVETEEKEPDGSLSDFLNG